MNILVDENIPYAEALFSRLGYVQKAEGRTISASTVSQADALIVRSVTKVDEMLLKGSRVKFVGTVTTGTDHIDKDWLEQAGIGFSAAPGCNAIAVVEYVLSALLWLAQRDGFALGDITVGIVGAGNVGGLLQRRLNVLGVRTMLCDPPLEEKGAPGDWKSLKNLVDQADVLTFHTPLTRHGRHATWHLVDEALLTALPAGRIIINTCRGAVINNTALLRTIEKGQPLSVVLDVWESEPVLSLPLLARIDIGTAHIAGYSMEGKARCIMRVFDAYCAFICSEVRESLASLLPPPAVELIRLRGVINEDVICLLAHLVYDVRRDDMRLRRVAGLPGEFDRLRKNYYQRREWSSLCVKTDEASGADTLRQLGFQSHSFRD
ncbi:DUF3410 domain-containing protein [Sodalis endosymbiont of Henestaris halophilus]|uniref:DUF3410 domain-containing protein n=1 Tax=Sodalis endosymbiont of Henestaris halophilus TaxID=1929246 RepID=UPI000BBFEA1D|nr:DUF3410 domain-containing protein [Sodalis endosymbiont of Henestaris halophilus]SNC58857.1 Erythronate-4-phosphate dehydrogenase [Sodalis endosymbiont of Henestaris halophilus]